MDNWTPNEHSEEALLQILFCMIHQPEVYERLCLMKNLQQELERILESGNVRIISISRIFDD
jgi:hypothetical protein